MDNDNELSRHLSSSDRIKSRLFSACAGLFTLGAAMSVDAALVSRLNGAAVYDTDLDITWIADANLAASNTFGVSGISTGSTPGRMTWDTAQTWLAAMNAANYLGFNDWRLPLTTAPDATCTTPASAQGYNCAGSEMGHLFYVELGGTAGSSILTSADPDLALFQNIRTNYYWSTDYTPTPTATTDAWQFTFVSGQQAGVAKTVPDNVWAVRTGDVLVPLPAGFWLLGSGLVGLSGFFCKNRTKT